MVLQQKNHNQRHFYWLDLVRFIAAFMVVAGHVRGFLFVDYNSLPTSNQKIGVSLFFLLTRLGHESVLIFFVLSGFLVGGRTIERVKTKSFNLSTYVLDRVTRIFLPLVAALIFIIIVNLSIGINLNWTEIIGNLFSLQGVLVSPATPPLWSLSYEVWFYIFMGTAAYFLATSRNRGRFISVIVLTICLLIFTVLQCHYLGIWLLAALTYHISVQKNRFHLAIYGVLSILFLGLLQISSESKINLQTNLSLYDARPIFEVLFSFFIAMFLRQLVEFQPKNRFEEKIDLWGTKLAKFTYTLYLVHFPFFLLLSSRFTGKQTQVNALSIMKYSFCIVASLIISYFVYLTAERNTNTVKNRLRAVLKKNQ